jgi:hypothetical protein
MAGNYRNVVARPSIRVLSETQVIDTEEVGFVTIPSGVYAQREVPRTAWLAEGAAAWVGPLATAIENLMAGGLATSASFVQDVDDSGLIADYLDFLVSYTPPGGLGFTLTATVRINVNALTLDIGFGSFVGGDPAQQLRDAYDRLVATANE